VLQQVMRTHATEATITLPTSVKDCTDTSCKCGTPACTRWWFGAGTRARPESPELQGVFDKLVAARLWDKQFFIYLAWCIHHWKLQDVVLEDAVGSGIRKFKPKPGHLPQPPAKVCEADVRTVAEVAARTRKRESLDGLSPQGKRLRMTGRHEARQSFLCCKARKETKPRYCMCTWRGILLACICG
jgi:hypothetical protein